jgi:hypothetical protein
VAEEKKRLEEDKAKVKENVFYSPSTLLTLHRRWVPAKPRAYDEKPDGRRKSITDYYILMLLLRLL